MYVIGIAGGSGSGKTTLANRILKKLTQDNVIHLSQDAYYLDTTYLPLEERRKLNYDHPDSIEWSLMVNHIRQLKAGNTIQSPVYSIINCSREPETIEIKPTKLLIVEGILLYTCRELCKEIDLKIFRDVAGDYRLSRIIERDMSSRGRSAEQVIDRYFKVVRPMHEEFIEKSKDEADILLAGGEVDDKAVDFIVQGIIQTMEKE
jgi:Uridine kinase